VNIRVGNPDLNNPTGIMILGKRSSSIFDNEVDFDFAAMYPNTNIAFNIAKSTMYGRFEIDGEIDSGKEFTENMIINNPSLLGSKWFNLPSFDVLYNEFLKSNSIRTHKKIFIGSEVNKEFINLKIGGAHDINKTSN
jgi:hypothetical protein